MNFIKEKQERNRFLKFAVVGLTGAVVDFGILNLLRLAFDMPLIAAQAISFICAVINNFIWNRFWTYPDSRTKQITKQLVQFFIINTIGILIRTPLITWLDQKILSLLDRDSFVFPISDMVISQNLALAIAILIILLWNFFANRYWTYNDIPGESGNKEEVVDPLPLEDKTVNKS